MGCVYKAGPRRKTWMIKYRRDGKTIVESAETTDWNEAKKLLRQKETETDRGLPVGVKVGRIRFEEAKQDVINDYRINERATLEDLERRLTKHLEPFFRARRLSSITTADVRAYIAQRFDGDDGAEDGAEDGADAGAKTKKPPRKPPSHAEINRELAILKRMFTLAIQAGKLYHRPHIEMLEERNVRTGFFDREQFTSVRGHLPTWLQGVATFAYLTGWRIQSEVLPLEWRQVDFSARVVRLDPESTKNRDGRVFPFGLLPELEDVLTGQRDRRDALAKANTICRWVFQHDGESLLDRSGERMAHAARVAWRAACVAAGCPGKIPHDFRRTAVRNLVRAGVSEKVAMQLTGHKTRSVFDRYDIVNESDLQAAVGKLAGAAAGDKSTMVNAVVNASTRRRRRPGTHLRNG